LLYGVKLERMVRWAVSGSFQ